MDMAPDWRAALEARFARSMPDVAGRVAFLPRMPVRDFMGVLGAADVLLDPPRFSGGNTTLEALSVGSPIVTLPHAFMRGRVTAAMMRQMGATEGIAATPDEYVAKALRLAADRDYRSETVRALKEGSAALFENRRVIEDLGAFLEGVLDKTGSS
jgi:predicted O-linked N-acetylglucosamine transferase (SPINDLY family)